MSILKKHIQPRERLILDNGQIIIYNPTPQEKLIIKNILEQTAKLQTNEDGNLSMETNFDETRMFRLLTETITNLSEDIKSLTDEEIVNLIQNGDNVIQDMIREFKNIIKEVSQLYIESITEQIDVISELLKNEESFNKLDEVLKSKNLNMQDLVYLSRQEDELKKELAKSKVAPQDHKKPQPKKRGRKKKVVEVVEDVEEVNINA